MPIQTLKDETRALFVDADKKIALAERFLADGSGGEKVRAAGELALLKRHRDELAARLRELEGASDGFLPTLMERLKEEGMLLRQALERLTVHH
jgi:hypothetical protein